MLSPDLALLEQLLSSTDYTSADAVEQTAAELHNRAYLVKVAIEYVRALMDLHVTLTASRLMRCCCLPWPRSWPRCSDDRAATRCARRAAA